MLMPVQDRCMVCAKSTIGQEIILDAPDELLGDVGLVEHRFGLFGDSVSVRQNRCTVCAEHTTCSKIILDAHDGTAS
jgi:hypothetical protein